MKVINFVPLPIIILGVIGCVSDINWWILLIMGAACAGLMILADWMIDRSRKARQKLHRTV